MTYEYHNTFDISVTCSILMTLQESANSSFAAGASGESLECKLNISGLNLVSLLITSDGGLENNSYDTHVSNNASQ
jgi:hypothetical protein